MYHHFARFYDLIFPFNNDSATALKRWIKLGGKAIDLGCATGHLVSFLHQNDMRASGVDLDPTMIEIARQNYPLLSFVSSDMVEHLKDQSDVDLLTCLGNTLPHLNKIQLFSFLNYAFHALSKDGIMIIQMLNYDKILHDRPKYLPDINIDHLIFQRMYYYAQDSIVFETKLTVDHHISKGSTILYPYLKEELKAMMEEVGFHVECYQNLKLEPWTPMSSHQTWLLKR